MAILLCDNNSLIKNGNCFNNCGLNTLINQAILVYFLEQIRAKKSGTAVRTPNQLRSAVASLGATPIDAVADGLDDAVAQVWAINSGVVGASTQTIAQIRAAANQFANMSIDELRTMEVSIRCSLASF